MLFTNQGYNIERKVNPSNGISFNIIYLDSAETQYVSLDNNYKSNYLEREDHIELGIKVSKSNHAMVTMRRDKDINLLINTDLGPNSLDRGVISLHKDYSISNITMINKGEIYNKNNIASPWMICKVEGNTCIRIKYATSLKKIQDDILIVDNGEIYFMHTNEIEEFIKNINFELPFDFFPGDADNVFRDYEWTPIV